VTTAAPAKKTAAPRKRAAKKAVSTPQTAEQTPTVSVADPDVYVPPTGLAEGFQSDGSGPLLDDRLTPRALENLTELATDGNTNTARKYWIAVLAKYGVTVPFVPVDESE